MRGEEEQVFIEIELIGRGRRGGWSAGGVALVAYGGWLCSGDSWRGSVCFCGAYVCLSFFLFRRFVVVLISFLLSLVVFLCCCVV